VLDFIIKNLAYRFLDMNSIDKQLVEEWMIEFTNQFDIKDCQIVFDERLWFPSSPEDYQKLILINVRLLPLANVHPLYFRIHKGLECFSFDGKTWVSPFESTFELEFPTINKG
jgi:hypothetical protein